MAKMLTAAHGRNQAERPDCCKNDDSFRAPSGKRLRKGIQRAREREQVRREVHEEVAT